MTSKKRVGVVDFFCGCGGASKGFQQAESEHFAFEVIVGIDNDPACCATFTRNIGAPAHQLDVRRLAADKSELEALIKSWNRSKFDAFLLIGCSPCQGFSAHRKAITAEDIRRDLFCAFCHIAATIQPDAVFIENVPDILSKQHWPFFKAGTDVLIAAGYDVKARPYNLAGFGLPQERFRTIVCASKFQSHLPIPPFSPQRFRTVRDVIGHLPSLQSGERSLEDPMHWVSNHRPETIAILKKVPKDGGNRPVGVGPKCLDRVRTSYGGYTDVYGRLSWDKPAVTLTGKCRTPSSGRYTHPEQNRGLSIREAALLQGFPSDFIFEGNFDTKYLQVGNAVPPIVARYFAEHIATNCLTSIPPANMPPGLPGIKEPVGPGFAIKINGMKKSRAKAPPPEPSVFTAVDLFSGAGGLSLGLKWAGFHVAAALDNEDTAVTTYSHNLGPHILHKSIMDVDAAEFAQKLRLRSGDLTLLAGGPPCQGFSVKGLGQTGDPRNKLLLEFFRFVDVLRPKFFLIENVLGLMSRIGKSHFDQAVERAEALGYHIYSQPVDTAACGVPQFRTRAIIVGQRKDLGRTFSFPAPLLRPTEYRTVRDAIGDLPSPPKDGSPHPVIPNHYRERRISAKNLERLSHIPEGGGRENLPQRLTLPCHATSGIRHVDTYGRLAFAHPSVTITARFDSFTRGRFGHPVEDRTITLREGARIQTFPDDFVFFGNREEIARQIGNAVPPLFAKSLGRSIIQAVIAANAVGEAAGENQDSAQLTLSV